MMAGRKIGDIGKTIGVDLHGLTMVGVDCRVYTELIQFMMSLEDLYLKIDFSKETFSEQDIQVIAFVDAFRLVTGIINKGVADET